MTKLTDKIDHAIILSRRIQNEMNSGNFDNALYLTDTFVFLFSGHQVAINELVASYTVVSQKLLNQGQIEQAETLISKGLLVDPYNSMMLYILVEVKKRQQQELKELVKPSVAGAEVLGKIGDERAAGHPLFPTFILTYLDKKLLKETGNALVSMRGPALVETLILALKDEDSTVRRYVAEALGKLGDSRAVESLIAALKDEDSTVRRYVAKALGDIGDQKAVDPLRAALKDEHDLARPDYAKALDLIHKR